MVSYTAAEMAQAVEEMVNTPVDNWGVFGGLSNYAYQWAKVYPQLSAPQDALSIALCYIGTAEGWQRLLDTCAPLAVAYRRLGGVESPLCPAPTLGGEPCGRALMNGTCDNAPWHA